MMTMLSHVTNQDQNAGPAQLAPGFRYLRVVTNGRVIFLASDTPDINDPGIASTWYSADREVLRFRNGRLVAAIGTATEWRNVLLPELPAWSEIASATQPVMWTRTRDVMPGYRFGVKDSIAVKRVPPPSVNHLVGVAPDALTWFEERLEPSRNIEAAVQDDLPRSLYAVDLRSARPAVIYGETCVSAKLCFTWQQWPAHPE